jgi:hypothetical protein
VSAYAARRPRSAPPSPISTAMTKIKLGFALGVLAFATGACSSGRGTGANPDFATVSTARALAAYSFYLAHNPDPYLVLSRTAAQERAYLGCGIRWSPSTVDGVLARAYKGICPSTPGNFP